MDRIKRTTFTGIMLLTPLLVLGAAEWIARLAWPGGALPLFVNAPFDAKYLVANRDVGRRWFVREAMPPAPMAEPFALVKPPNGFRVFVLGESSTAGFPYPRNGAFSRVLREMLRDALPNDSVEVINLGIAATNSYTLVDIAKDVIDQAPDAVVLYAGHNEYYGVLGVASAENVVGASAWVKRVYLRLLRSRLVLALRSAITSRDASPASASLMEALAGGREIRLASDAYAAGVKQFEANLEHVLERFREAGVPVFVGSLTSNLRDQHPFAAHANRGPANAEGLFLEGRQAMGAGDSLRARTLFARARDLDVIRFRAPGEFNSVVRRVARDAGAAYVPIDETISAMAPMGVPGAEFFLEHVHLRAEGYAIIARTFFEAMAASEPLSARVRRGGLRPWSEYVRRMQLTALDHAIVAHTVRTLTTRWPFVQRSRQRDYRAAYQPVDTIDSLAFAVSRGASWEKAKLAMAQYYEQRGITDSAIAEYEGLARDAPYFEAPWQNLGAALLRAGRQAEAERALNRAFDIAPSTGTANALAGIALQRRDFVRGTQWLRLSLRLDARQPAVLHQLSMALAMGGDIEGARSTAMALQRLSPQYPGLNEWLSALGVQSAGTRYPTP